VTLDALTTACAIEDDGLVVDLIARKHYGQFWCGAPHHCASRCSKPFELI
jgi:hypothetical protein